MQENESVLQTLASWEDLAEKKTKIYSRLLTDTSLAEDMEMLSARHARRKETLLSLYCGKARDMGEDENVGSRDEVNEE
ncbi:MAG: hypothetical protein IJX88_03155 [Clostridia bacterium]|nr:hypothetical protein [Clostridia bacterium]